MVHSAEYVTPVAVVDASGPAFPQKRANGNPPDPEYAAERAIDGDPATFCCLLDDTCAGDRATTIPAQAAEPVTGHIVFDLGRPLLVLGARLTGRQSGGVCNPRHVDFYHFSDDDPAAHSIADDIEGDPGIHAVLAAHACAPLRGGAQESVEWNGVMARYVGVRVNSSYESGGATHYNFQIGEIEFLVAPEAKGLEPGQRVPSTYVKKTSVVETMLASRKQFHAWYGSLHPSSQRVESFWEQLRRDFPEQEYPLLSQVNYGWFAKEGWLLRAHDTHWERQFVRQISDDLGSEAQSLVQQLDTLIASQANPEDRRWLDLCVTAAKYASLMKQFASLRAAVEDLAVEFPQRYPRSELEKELSDLHSRVGELASITWTHSDPATQEIARDLRTLQRRALIEANPLLPEKLLFVRRYTYSPGWYYAEFMRAYRFGGNLCVLSLVDGEVTELCPELAGGIFDRFDLSFDGRRVVFGYKAKPGVGFRIYEVSVDGTGLRQLTFDPPDEAQRIAKYWHPHNKPSGVYRHHTDDFHPCYLPDGGICFASTRCEQGVLCDQGDSLSVNVLYRMDSDGRNITRLSQGALSESTPSVMNDGRILYTRWEYVDKGVIAVQSLWAMHPDGSRSTEVYGNQIEVPPVLIHGRAIPGANHLFVATATMHHPFAVGPVMLIDIRRDIRGHAPLHSLTPDTGLSIQGVGGFPVGEQYTHFKNGRWIGDNVGPLFSEPYPLGDSVSGAGAGKYFLVDCNPDRAWNDPQAYGLYLIDVFGNRVPIYSDPEISCWQPVPLSPRPCPPVLPPAGSQLGSTTPCQDEAVVVMTDVYEGLDDVPRGAIKYLRILEQVPRPWAARRFWPHDETLGQHAVISMHAHIYVKIHHGVVPVLEDGSAHFLAPARKNIFFQALDENFMEVQRMRSFVNFQPGEARTCVGCHERRNLAAPSRIPLALSREPIRPQPQPGETVPRPLHYTTDVQPVLDRHCTRCHNSTQKDGELDLCGEITTYFNRSYESIMQKKLVAFVQEFVGPQPRAQKTNVVTLPPRSLGSHASRLISVLREGHYDVHLTREEMIRLITWADANAPYYGSYFGRRNALYRDHPDFRTPPTLQTACGIPP
jgi:hypothetical protein